MKRIDGFKGKLSAFRIVLIYFVVAVLWIAFSDLLLNNMIDDTATLSRFQTYKGWFYVVITSLGLYWLIREHDIELGESEDRWKVLVQNNPDLILILEGMKVRFVNEAGARMYGAESTDELTGRNLFELVELGDRKLAEARLQKVLEGERVEPIIHKVTAPDGNIRSLEVQSLPVIYRGERAIQIVGRDVTERIHSEEQIQRSLREKETLLQEIHHRVKNNLAVISGLLEMPLMNTDSEEVQRILRNSQNRIKSMALIHEKLYREESLSKIHFKSYLSDLVEAIRKTLSSGDRITFGINCDDTTLNVNQALPCALILNELITNALIHAFKGEEKGNILVDVKERDGTIRVTVRDNGKGLPEAFSYADDGSMGFSIVRTLVKQLEADLVVNSAAEAGMGTGTEVALTFEKREVRGSTSSLI